LFNFQLNNILGKSDKIEVILGLNAEDDLNLLLRECKKYLKVYNEQKVRRAFHLCLDAHANKSRKSGAPYYTHPVEVARIVMSEIPLDDVSVIAALLHDVLDEGDNFTIKDIRSEFGNDIADIVEGVHKIEHIENTNISIADQAENYRKLLLSLFKDIRIILVKLADRLHNMRTLEYVSETSRMKLARETLDIYAPFANRFGLRNIKWELEDLSFKYLNSESYLEIKAALKSTREEREQYIENLIAPIKEKLKQDELLKKAKLKYEINGRPKHIFSIYNKMLARNKPMEELYDLFAIRLILDTEEPNLCFYIYGLVAGIYQPVPDTFKDYINAPKKNGYRSIHSAIVGHDTKIVELQIRTLEMHELAEQGFAAHFRYKGGRIDQASILERRQIVDWIQEVREIFDNAKSGTNEELIENFRQNLFFDEIYVYTPKNEFRTLPKDATPLDFAYDIHSEVGNHFISAKVNGKVVAIDYKLQSGDQIEIITSKKQNPSEEWLQYVTTPRAKQSISKFLKEKERLLTEEGKIIWTEKSKENSIKLNEMEFAALIKSLRYENPDEFFFALAQKEIAVEKAFDFIKFKIRDGLRSNGENRERGAVLRANGDVNKNGHNGKLNGNGTLLKLSDLKPNDDGSLTITMIIRATKKSSMLQQINTAVLSISDTEILEMSYDEVESDLRETLTINFNNFSHAEVIYDNLKKIDGVKDIEILKK
jgi:GTP diphosphokinase / guanosine-3',5'-bis(diphosphate) 3'-diphosphatase